MAIFNGWNFSKDRGFTGSADKGKTAVSSHERAVPGYAKGGHVKAPAKSTTPPPKPQKHFDRMENYRKERDAEPAPPAKNDKAVALAKGGKPRVMKKAEGGSVNQAIAPSSKLGIPGGDGTKNVVGFKKGGKSKSVSRGTGGGTAAKAAGALAKIAAMASQQSQAGSAPPPDMGAMPPPGASPLQGLPAMKRGGAAKKKK